ncbi:hypothetical protein EDD21DRAFT_363429 [Dissophora ornata]|nr:hypothetical protein EDD21DRAFT_363429 [Dissophora ornata]
MLVQENFFAKNRLEVGDSSAGVTSSVEAVDGRGWIVVDTGRHVGANGIPEAIELMARAAREGWTGYHLIAFVVPEGRLLTDEYRTQFTLFKQMFRGAESNFVLIITRLDQPEENRDEIEAMFGKIPVIPCDFENISNHPNRYKAKFEIKPLCLQY